jgi:tetratricopeptide (TPR) repeat protein
MQKKMFWVWRLAMSLALLAMLVKVDGGVERSRTEQQGLTLRPAMLILWPDAAQAAESFSKFLKQISVSGEWTAAIRQVYHITMPDTASTALKIRSNTTSCNATGKAVIFLLGVQAGELESLREKSKLAGNEEVEMRRRKKRKRKVVDLHNPCVAWIEEDEDVSTAAGMDVTHLTAAMHRLPSPYRNTVRREEEAEGDSPDATTGPTGKHIPASWRTKRPLPSVPKDRANLGYYALMEAGSLSLTGTDFEAAAAFFRKALDLLPDSVAPLNKLGSALMGGGKRQDALELYRDAVDRFPRDVTARMNLGSVLEEEDSDGSLASARLHYAAALALSPRSATQMAAMAQIDRKVGNSDAAYAAYNGSLALLAARGVARADHEEIHLQVLSLLLSLLALLAQKYQY